MNNSKLIELASCLEQAAGLVSAQPETIYADHFQSPLEFGQFLASTSLQIKSGDVNRLQELRLLFLPTSEWDEVVGREGMELANKILQLVDELLKSQK